MRAKQADWNEPQQYALMVSLNFGIFPAGRVPL
jgi:hypothetical protein